MTKPIVTILEVKLTQMSHPATVLMSTICSYKSVASNNTKGDNYLTKRRSFNRVCPLKNNLETNFVGNVQSIAVIVKTKILDGSHKNVY